MLCMPDLISTAMDHSLWADKPSPYVISRLGQLSHLSLQIW